jgi:hypothetical protein
VAIRLTELVIPVTAVFLMAAGTLKIIDVVRLRRTRRLALMGLLEAAVAVVLVSVSSSRLASSICAASVSGLLAVSITRSLRVSGAPCECFGSLGRRWSAMLDAAHLIGLSILWVLSILALLAAWRGFEWRSDFSAWPAASAIGCGFLIGVEFDLMFSKIIRRTVLRLTCPTRFILASEATLVERGLDVLKSSSTWRLMRPFTMNEPTAANCLSRGQVLLTFPGAFSGGDSRSYFIVDTCSRTAGGYLVRGEDILVEVGPVRLQSMLHDTRVASGGSE